MPKVDGLYIDKLSEFGIVLEKNYTLSTVYEYLQGKKDCQNLQKILNAPWGQEIIYFDYAGHSVVILTAQGAPFAANSIERLKRTGVKEIVFIGTTGSTHKNILPETFVLPSAAVRDEGTSDGYLDKYVPAICNLDLRDSLENELKNNGAQTLNGLIFTTDKRYKEDSKTLVHLNKHANVVAVDMETATAFITAMYYNIPLAAIKIVTDCAVGHGDASFQGVLEKDKDYKKWIQPFINLALDSVLNHLKTN